MEQSTKKDWILDDSEIIKTKPLIYFGGVLIRDEKHLKREELKWNIAIACGLVGGLGFMAMLSYQIQQHCHCF